MTDAVSSVVSLKPLFLRVRDVASVLAVSDSMIAVFVRRGLLHPIKMPGIRAVRFAIEDVEELARRIRAGELEVRQ